MLKGKILILTNRVPYPLKDGGNLAMKTMVDGYSSAGWQVFLFSMNTSRHFVPPAELKDIYKNIYKFETVNVNNDIKPLATLRNFFFSKQPNHAERFASKLFATKLAEVLAEFKPDVVQVESVFLSGYLRIIKKQSHAVAVLRMHNVEHQIWSRFGQKVKNILGKIYYSNLAKRMKTFEEHSWGKYDLLLPITQTDAEEVLSASVGTPMLVAPFGINMVQYNSGNVEEKWNGYHIGAMDWRPNRESIKWFLDEAWPKLHKMAPDFQFYFAGRHMPQSFKDLNIEGVHCMGEVEDANEFIADKKILIVPLRSGGGIRVKILEAMAAGKVVVSTRMGVQGIDVTEGVHYMHAHSGKPGEFVEAINWCLKNKEKAEQMANAAQKLVLEHYENGKIMEKIINKIDRIMHPDK